MADFTYNIHPAPDGHFNVLDGRAQASSTKSEAHIPELPATTMQDRKSGILPAPASLPGAGNFHPAPGSSAGQPVSATCDDSGKTQAQALRGQLPGPDDVLGSGVAGVPDSGAASRDGSRSGTERCGTMKRLALDKGAEWCRILREARPYLRTLSLQEAATIAGTSAATLCRLVQKFGKLEDHELSPERLAPELKGGVASDFEVVLKLPEVLAEMHRLYAATMGASCAQATHDRRTGSMATTLLRLADFPGLPAHLAERLRGGTQPQCLVNLLRASWTPEMEAKFRGQKHYATATIAGRRDLTEELADGSIVPLRPGRVWVFDDMSSNIPFWFECDAAWANNGDKGSRQLIERHGCCLGRQGLYAWDWASGAWLGLELVGRMRDAYQASDILRFIRKLVQIYGKPEKIIMERGVWQSRAISGWVLAALAGGQDEEALKEIPDAWERPAMAADESARIQDGIRAIGVNIIHTYTPRGKPIEGAFNHHQRLVPTFLKPGEAVNIGRHAGEFEWSARQQRRGSNGVQHPRDLGFIHIDRLADVAWEAMVWEGNHDKARRDGHPLEILTSYLQAQPLPPVSERDLAVFLPEKRSGAIRNGTITVQVNGDTHQFLNPEVFAALGDGSRVDFAFDPAEPTLGAAVYNERGFLCWSNYLPAGPVISALDRSEAEAVQLLKRYKLAHRTAARMLDLKTLRTVKTSARRDGSGQVATLQRGGSESAESAPTAGTATAQPQRVMNARHTIFDSPTKEQKLSRGQRLAASAARSRELMVLADGQ